MRDVGQIRRRLGEWYDGARRNLPWRQTRDPYRIWVSEIMLQQTRVAAVLPYYERFLSRFPDAASLARASEQDVLAAWSGLGYYSRARNLHQAAMQVAGRGEFPSDHETIRALPGVGDYTAAAIASIAFERPYAAVDGNVLRVLSRLTAESGDIGAAAVKQRLRGIAGTLLDRKRPGRFNQALMELGATVCLPRQPRCPICPLSADCEARKLGLEDQLPVKVKKTRVVRVEKTLLLVERNGRLLLWQRTDGRRLRGFWELPEAEQLPQARLGEKLGDFRHSIMNHAYMFTLVTARARRIPRGFFWVRKKELSKIPLSTVTKKALRC